MRFFMDGEVQAGKLAAPVRSRPVVFRVQRNAELVAVEGGQTLGVAGVDEHGVQAGNGHVGTSLIGSMY
jgi:hypothetical protein